MAAQQRSARPTATGWPTSPTWCCLRTTRQDARPLYDLFQNKNRADQLAPADLEPFNAVPDPGFINERVADLPQTPATKALERQSRALPKGMDTQGPLLEQIDWQATTNRPIPPALAREVDQAASGAVDD